MASPGFSMFPDQRKENDFVVCRPYASNLEDVEEMPCPRTDFSKSAG